MYQDPEIIAMSVAFTALNDLDNDQRKRIIGWLADRFDLSGKRPPESFPRTVKKISITSIDTEVDNDSAPAAIVEPVRRGRKPKNAAGGKTDAPKTPKVPEKKDFSHYDTALELFSEAKVKKSTDKILLMAAYLQVRHNFQEITSYDMNFRLKRIGHGVSNISSSLNAIISRKPEIMVQLDKESTHKQARRKFKVTEEGLKMARRFLPGNPE